MKTLLRPALVLFILLTLITGVIYPLAVTGIEQGLLPGRANDSLLLRGGQAIGGGLIVAGAVVIAVF